MFFGRFLLAMLCLFTTFLLFLHSGSNLIFDFMKLSTTAFPCGHRGVLGFEFMLSALVYSSNSPIELWSIARL